MKNWKTTLGGLVAAVGTYLVNSQTGVLQILGQVLAVVGTLLLGHSAADANSK
jgi:drug/metabolite transporter (DMT)-like permease